MSTPTFPAADSYAVSHRVASHVTAVDATRALSVLAIVWTHCAQSSSLQPTTIAARFAIPFFVFSSVFFAVQSSFKPDRDLRAYTLQRFKRLYLPFLIWSGGYAAAASFYVADGSPYGWGWWILMLGTARHLWFLPFVFGCTWMAFALAKRGLHRHWPFAAGLVIAGTISGGMRWTDGELVSGLSSMWQALPAACWGFAFAGLSFDGNHDSKRTNRLVTHKVISAMNEPISHFMFFGFVALFVVNAVCIGRNVLLENLAGAAVFVVAYRSDHIRVPTTLRDLAPLAMGVYLCHLLFVIAFDDIAIRLEFDRTPSLDFAIYAATLALSILATALLRKSCLKWAV